MQIFVKSTELVNEIIINSRTINAGALDIEKHQKMI